MTPRDQVHARPGSETPLLDVDTVAAYLAETHLLEEPVIRAERLSGGVSCVVLRLHTAQRIVVLKQARHELDVADDWFADPTRSASEAAALDLLHTITPEQVPELVAADPRSQVVIMSAAPPTWANLKHELLRGAVEPERFEALGSLLARWQSQTHVATVPAALRRTDLFQALRIRPYFETAARRLPALGEPILTVAADLAHRHEGLVHGDFSPKNIMVDPASTKLWVLDFEVATVGDRLFDAAFMSAHLLLKWRHLPTYRPALAAALSAFLTTYAERLDPSDAERLSKLVGCLLLARVVGSSPVEYLDDAERADVLAAGERLLTRPEHREAWTGVFR